MPEINIPVTIYGRDMIASIEYTVTDRGRKGGHDFPAEDMEFELTALMVDDVSLAVDTMLAGAILDHYEDRIYDAIEDNEGG